MGYYQVIKFHPNGNFRNVLDVGRSSVREALRALELLGVIETRRGEGTFIKDFQEHRLVSVPWNFFLKMRKSMKLAETKYFLEIDCLRLIIYHSTDEELEKFMSWADKHILAMKIFF